MIESLKDLQKLFKMCREQGVDEFKFNGVEIKFGDMPEARSSGSIVQEEVTLNPYDGFPQDILSPERLSHYAHGGTVEDDPFLELDKKKAN